MEILEGSDEVNSITTVFDQWRWRFAVSCRQFFAWVSSPFRPREEEKEFELRLFQEYHDHLYRLAVSYLRNKADAEDIVQDVMLQVIRKQPQFNDREHERAWLFRVTINLCKNKLKKKPQQDYDQLSELFGEELTEDLTYLWEAVGKLPQNYREALHMFYYENYKTKEIAKVLGKNENTVRSDLARGREKLKAILEGDYQIG